MGEPGYSLLDIHLAKFLANRSRLTGAEKNRFQELVQVLSAALDDGHSCLEVGHFEELLLASVPLVSAGFSTPLALHNHRLYLQRYFYYEHRLAKQIKELASQSFGGKESLFPSGAGDVSVAPSIDWQREAIRIALAKRLTIICGGPGTGKTTTVVRILVSLLQNELAERKIALAAPTGKAAMRLSESVGRSIAAMDLPESVRSGIPGQALTLHRLLGVRRLSPQFMHTRENPMPWDMVVVDEASMVDLAMMSKLVDGLKPGARLLLLGDKDQLASVESGAVLGDLIAALPENTVELRKTYRFDGHIKRLAGSVNNGDIEAAWGILNDPGAANVSILNQDPLTYIIKKYRLYLEKVCRNPPTETRAIFAEFNRFQVLCGVRHASRGVAGINQRVEIDFARQGFGCNPDGWYNGRPVLITRNDYNLELFNGDIGICLANATGELQVWFERTDGDLRSYPPHRLPRCETVFAMTIHKSQGSEFDEVLVVLPEEDNRILSRELIYTAVTRAKKSIVLVASKEVLTAALSRNIVRMTGLADQLREQDEERGR